MSFEHESKYGGWKKGGPGKKYGGGKRKGGEDERGGKRQKLGNATYNRRKAFVRGVSGKMHTLTAGRRTFGGGKRTYKKYKRKGSSKPNLSRSKGKGEGQYRTMRPFGVTPKNAGTKILRAYKTSGYFNSTAAAFSANGYSHRFMNTAGVLTLELWLGTPAAGTLIATYDDFTAEAAHYVDVFKWMKCVGVDFNVWPIANAVEEVSTSVTDMTLEADSGIFHAATWNGDQATVSPGGIVGRDRIEFERMKPKTMKPISQRGLTLAYEPSQIITTPAASVIGGNTTLLHFPKMSAIETTQMRTAGAYFPFYGHQWYWWHPNLATNAQKCRVGFTITVMVQWNTLYDADILAAKKEKHQQQLMRNPATVHEIALEEDGVGNGYYTVQGKTFKQEFEEKKTQEVADDDDVLSYEMADVQVAPKAPPNTPVNQQAAPRAQANIPTARAPVIPAALKR